MAIGSALGNSIVREMQAKSGSSAGLSKEQQTGQRIMDDGDFWRQEDANLFNLDAYSLESMLADIDVQDGATNLNSAAVVDGVATHRDDFDSITYFPTTGEHGPDADRRIFSDAHLKASNQRYMGQPTEFDLMATNYLRNENQILSEIYAFAENNGHAGSTKLAPISWAVDGVATIVDESVEAFQKYGVLSKEASLIAGFVALDVAIDKTIGKVIPDAWMDKLTAKFRMDHDRVDPSLSQDGFDYSNFDGVSEFNFNISDDIFTSRATRASDDFTVFYHGTSSGVASDIRLDGINLSKGSEFSDFGQGFYVTKSKEEALKSGSRLYENDLDIVEFKVPNYELENLTQLNFLEADTDWADFVKFHKNFGPDDLLHGRDPYDMVSGPLFKRYTGPDKKPIAWTDRTDQTSIHTQSAVDIFNRYMNK